MARNYKFISSRRVISKVVRDYGFTDISEDDIVEWVGEVLASINVTSIKETAVQFVEIENHQATLEPNIEELVQVFVFENPGDAYDISTVIQSDTEENLKVTLYKDGYQVCDNALPTYTGNFTARFEHYDDVVPMLMKRNFRPIRLANHTMFQGIVCESVHDNISGCREEYQLFNDTIKTSFKEGILAIAYRTTVLDEEGFPMIPDSPAFLNAISSYIIYRVTSKYWYQGREGYGDKMQKAEQDYQYYVRQATSEAFLPYGLDDHQDMAEASRKILRTTGDYYNGYGNLGNSGNIKYKGR